MHYTLCFTLQFHIYLFPYSKKKTYKIRFTFYLLICMVWQSCRHRKDYCFILFNITPTPFSECWYSLYIVLYCISLTILQQTVQCFFFLNFHFGLRLGAFGFLLNWKMQTGANQRLGVISLSIICCIFTSLCNGAFKSSLRFFFFFQFSLVYIWENQQ